MEPGIVILGVILLIILVRILAGSFDGDRVESYLRGKGYELLEKSWDPMGPGWSGEKDARIYEVIYRDTSGKLHQAHVKTSMMSGVYLTNDRFIDFHPNHPNHPNHSIQDEKAMLMKRLAEIEAQERV